MLVAEFHDPRLARLYDATCLITGDSDFYLELAGVRPLDILDLCCGTGVLATALAARGHRVTGVDRAAPMLEIARHRPDGHRVTWQQADARSLVLPATFDLVVQTGHAFQAFLRDADIQDVLRAVRAVLRPGGRFAFETRNPQVQGWEHWDYAKTRHLHTADGIAFAAYARVRHVIGAYVDVSNHYRLSATGEELVSRQVLRFAHRAEVERHLAAAGFAEEAVYGDWDRSPVTEQSPELIFITRGSPAG